MPKSLTAFFDGASKGNPGPSGIGGVILDGEKVLEEISRYIGTGTNNQAEYSALLEVLRKAAELGASVLSVYSDSELVVRQLNGEYQVKDPKLRPLFIQAMGLRSSFEKVTFRHVPREKNKLADSLANAAVEEAREGKEGWVEVTLKSVNLKSLLGGFLREINHASSKENLASTLEKLHENVSENGGSVRVRLKRDGKSIHLEL